MIPNRIIIDTNVVLDLLVFADPRWSILLAALEQGSVQAFTRADCRQEFQIVLGYSHLPLDDVSRAAASQRFDQLMKLWTGEAAPTRLPLCKDGDDQKFLELARDCSASVLITKDKALLKLAGKTARAGLFRILKPEAWHAERASMAGAPS